MKKFTKHQLNAIIVQPASDSHAVHRQFPQSVELMKYGYDCFEQVYPLPVWRSAYQRAKAALAA